MPNFKRRKIECLLCNKTFDSDYRTRHNKKYHVNCLKNHRHIPYKNAGAPANPFQVSLFGFLIPANSLSVIIEEANDFRYILQKMRK